MKTFIHILIQFFIIFPTLLKGQDAFVYWPRDYSVVQRNNSGGATVHFNGWISSYLGSIPWHYKIEKLSSTGSVVATEVDWTGLYISSPGNTFQVSRTLSTGWYRFQLRGSSSSYYYVTGPKFGVGEVIFIAGQSNAEGHKDNSSGSLPSTYPGTVLDCIVSSEQSPGNQCSSLMPQFPVFTNIKNSASHYIAPNGDSPWAYMDLGNQIASSTSGTVTPTLFVNAGAAGTSIDNWYDTSINPGNKSNFPWGGHWCSGIGNDGVGEPYRTFRNNLNFYGFLLGTRGVLWHQGETDGILGTSTTDYQTKLQNVISKSRTDFNAGLSWAVSKVSWYGGGFTSSAVTTAQTNVKNTYSNVSWGADNSDLITIAGDRGGDDLHFIYNGLSKLASNYWSNMPSGLFSQPIVPADYLHPVTVTKSGSVFTLTAPSGYSCYQWVYYNPTSSIAGYASTFSAPYPSASCAGSNVMTTSASGRWFCYMMDSNRNVRLTRITVINDSDFSSLRIAVNEKMAINFYPNSIKKTETATLDISLPKDGPIRVDLIEPDGTKIRNLYEKDLKKGNISIPVNFKETDCSNSGYCTKYIQVTFGEQLVVKRILLSN